MRCVLALMLLGCGRLDFGARVDATVDIAPPVARRCNDPAVPPPTLTVSGTTYYFTSFTTTNTLPSIVATIVDGEATPPSAVSDAQGHYSVSVATHGAPVVAKLVYSSADPMQFVTTYWLDAPLARDVTGTDMPPYALIGDAPVWNSGAMAIIYTKIGVAEDTAAGTLNIRTTDCAGNPVAGVSVTVTPPPGQMMYLGSDAVATSALTETVPPYDAAFAANAVAGPTHLSFAGGGLHWPELDLDVLAGSNNTVVVVRGD